MDCLVSLCGLYIWLREITIGPRVIALISMGATLDSQMGILLFSINSGFQFFIRNYSDRKETRDNPFQAYLSLVCK